MKKRYVSLLLAAVMVLQMIPLHVFASDTASITASSAEKYAGNSATISVGGNNLSNLGSVDLEIYYNNEALTLNSARSSTLLSNATVSINSETAGVVKVSAISLEGINGNGTMLTLNFKVNSDCPVGKYPIQVTVGDAYAIDLTAATIAGGTGYITVLESTATPKTFSLDTTLTPTSASKGDTITFKVNNSNRYSFASGDFTIEYDSDVLALEEISLDSNLTVEGAVYSTNTALLGSARVSYASNVEISSYHLMDVTFTVLADEDVSTTIKAIASDVYGGDLSEYYGSSYSRTLSITRLPEEVVYPKLQMSNIQDMIVGEEYTATLHLEEDAAVAAADFVISFDPDVFQCVSVTASEGASSKGAMLMLNENYDDGEIRFSYVNQTGYAEGIDLVDVTWKVLSSPAEHYRISLSGAGVKTVDYKDIQLDYVESSSCIYKTDVTQPTCTEAGHTVYTCLACNDIKDEESPALGHTEMVDVAVEATCTETGLTEGKHCSVCDEVFVAQEVIPSLGHTEVVDKAVVPTATESGLTEGSHCSVCGEVLIAQKVIPAYNDLASWRGDVNLDGKVNIVDVQRLYAHLNGSNPLVTQESLAIADVNTDGKINIVDVQRLYAHLNGSNPLS